ncbi:hypothetical protein [Thioalkalivibrio sp. ALE12]|uniref:hypothetical protein n=1 Tax=Thioalkalivibrio sp. ALE12 TaxID=1158170 RepID=UPI0003A1607D|nr:hypothetical protein [Thioalkalivibrio sp. ALE12]
MNAEHPLLRAINLQYDADTPERIAHYEPTSKAVRFLEGVSGETPHRAFFVIAPYGSGKSLGATYLLHLLENRASASGVLETIGKRLESVSPELADFAQRRLARGRPHGVAIVLEGAIQDIGEALGRAAAASLRRLGLKSRAEAVEALEASGINGAIGVLEYLVHTASKSKAKNQIDRIAIIWDEFGRHVEQLVRSGRPDQLAEIQTLAEYAARSRVLPVTFGPIMHQGLLQYASGLSQTALTEWRKIEGRFEPIQYVDDSHELYWLIAKVVSNNRPSQDLFEDKGEKAQRARAVGLFGDFGAELPDLLRLASPLDPATLHILPQLAARVAQHERTLFGFLLSADLSRPVTVEQVYDYFAGAMQADTALGGTYRKWLETESALAKAEDAHEIRALKSASVLELGLAGNRQRVTRELLEFALSGGQAATLIVDTLLERKLLLHRRRSNQVSLWHGTDIDLRARLDEEIARQDPEIDPVGQLNADFPPTPLRPLRHNDHHGLRRYFAGTFASVDAFHQWLTADEQLLAPGEDGRIVYLVPSDEAERQRAVDVARRCEVERLLVVVPASVGDFRSAAVEVRALERLASDEVLLAEDPLAEKELQQMLDEAQAHLHAQATQLTHPGADTVWYHRGEALEISDVASVFARLSEICDAAFHTTPKINNEMIVRHRLSAPLVNARKKLVMGILERHGQERLGIQGENADASVFRTVLERTGLYRPKDDGEGYRYAQPEELDDPNLEAVWRQFQVLVTEPTDSPKDLEAFFEQLTEPPIGLRRGVIPIFFAAALRAFQTTLAITNEKGEYVDDLLPSVIEDICNRPNRYALTVFEFNEEAKQYLQALTRTFSSKAPNDARNSGDLMRQAFDAFEAWCAKLPPGARDSRIIGTSGRALQSLVRAPFSPFDLFFRRFPQLAESKDLAAVVCWIVEAKAELESVLSRYREEALTSLDGCLQLDANAPIDSERERFDYWRRMLPTGLGDHLGGVPRNLLNLNLDFYRSDDAFIDAAAALLVGRQPKRWDDADLQRFRNEVSSVTSRIEASALADTQAYGEDAANLVERRLKIYISRLVDAVGADAAHRRLDGILSELEHEEHDGEPRRSATHGR